MNLSKKY